MKVTMPPQKPQDAITIEEFTEDLWEAMRSEAREQLSEAVPVAQFNKQLPPWKKLPVDVRAQKMKIAHDELLQILDRAGYVVRKKRRAP